MRIRRFVNGEEFRANLEADESDVLPLLFADVERDWIARTIDPELAMLAAGSERPFGRIGVGGGPDDWVLAPPSGIETLLATRYAAIAGRPLVLADLASVRAAFAGRAPRSVTWFCPLDELDIASALDALCGALMAELGKMPRLGVLTAESVSKLSWLLAKQLLPQGGDRTAATTLVSMEPTAPPSSLTHVGSGQTVAEVVAGMNGATGTLLVNAHSRPHCGILKVADGPVGMCGLASGGAGGRCVDGTACFFGEAPRAVLQDLLAPRIYFNGCTTAGVGGRRQDFLPRKAMVCHAALRGGAREFIGNVRSGYYDETDLDWFLGASALGHTPAECVEVITAARTSTGRETIRSALYFGDATNAAWPVRGVSVGEVVVEKKGVRIRWPRSDRVLVARVPGGTWADLAEHDRLHAGTRHPSQPRILIVRDPFCDGSIVLVVPRAGGEGSSPEIEVLLLALAKPIERSIGGVLARAVEQVRWLGALPAFAKVLADASRQLEEELVTLRRAVASRLDVKMLPELVAYARTREGEAARRFDGLIIDEALSRSQGYWNWQMEYGPRVQATPRKRRSSCPSCGAFANDVDYVDWAIPRLARTSKVCGYCGIVADLPVWRLRVRIVPEALVSSATELRGRAEVSNDCGRTRRVTLGLAVERGGEMRPESIAKAEGDVGGGETSSFAFILTPVKPMTELFQTRLYIASEGAFGLVSTFMLFGREPEREGPVH